MTYRFKIDQEAVWFVLTAAGTVILQALATLDIDKVADWRIWAVGLLVASIRAGAGAALSLLTKPALPAEMSDKDIGRLADELLKQQKAARG